MLLVSAYTIDMLFKLINNRVSSVITIRDSRIRAFFERVERAEVQREWFKFLSSYRRKCLLELVAKMKTV